MTVLWVLALAAAVLLLAGRFYSRFLARCVGEDPSRPTPAVAMEDGRDYVPTPTGVVFAHHFASIAGAGPIIGPVIAIVYGWAPAVIWVVLGGALMGAVHDYMATYMTTREGGQSIAVIVRKALGNGPFVAITVLLIVMLALVCAMFLNLSASALTSTVEMSRLKLDSPGVFRTVQAAGADGKATDHIVVGGIASMSVVCITAVAPLLGYLYLKRKVAVWKCSILAIAVCIGSIAVGVYRPIPFKPLVWQLLLSGYVLVAAGVPVWLFLQSRDFINVHILYVGLVALVVILVAAGISGAQLPDADQPLTVQGAKSAVESHTTIQPFSVGVGARFLKGPLWPVLFITIACGAVSGFHSLCAGGTTCKQLTSEPAARRIGYYGMLLDSFLAVCVIAVCMIGIEMLPHLKDVFPKFFNPDTAVKSNPVLAFAMAVGWTANLSLGVPIAVGVLAGMILLEGFLVTTLDTAVRLTRYLIEEVWRTLLGRYDVFAAPPAAKKPQAGWMAGEPMPIGAGGIPAVPPDEQMPMAKGQPVATSGAFRALLKLLRQYWVNSALAVGLMLAFALTGGVLALWGIFATSNQLLAAMVLSLAALWLLRQKRRSWFTIAPALFMLATTGVSLAMMLRGFLADPAKNATLLTANIVIIVITIYLLIMGAAAAVAHFRKQQVRRV